MTVKKKNNKGTQKQETQTELKNSLEEIRLDQEEEIRKLEDSKLLSQMNKKKKTMKKSEDS